MRWTRPSGRASAEWEREGGTQLVEFALALPLFLFIVMLAIDGGRMLTTYIALKNASREVALYAAFNPTATTADLKQVAQQEGNGFLKAGDIPALTVTRDIQGGHTWGGEFGKGMLSPGVTLKLTEAQVDYNFYFINPVLSALPQRFWRAANPLPNPLRLSSTASAAQP